MASAKRVVGTILIVLAVLLTGFFAVLLYAKSVDDETFAFVKELNSVALIVAVGVGLVIIVLLLMILIRSRDERRNRREEEEEAARLAAEAAAREQFEAGLMEPEGIGKGPDIQVYNLGALPQMYKAWTKYERKTKTHTFLTPRTAEGAIYTNTYLPLDKDGTQLKVRILLAGPQDAHKGELPLRNSQKAVTEIDPKVLATIPEDVRNRLPADVRERHWPTGETTVTETTVEETVTTTTVPAAGKPGDGREFLQELEQRLAARKGVKNGADKRAYYDYTGDIHDVEDVEGIGRIYASKLHDAGVFTTARLSYEDPKQLSAKVGVPEKTVQQWRHMAELMKIKGVGKQYAEALARSGVEGIAELKRRSPDAIAEQVNSYLDSLETNVLGQVVTAKRIEGWQKAAAKMKKTRLQVPEK